MTRMYPYHFDRVGAPARRLVICDVGSDCVTSGLNVNRRPAHVEQAA